MAFDTLVRRAETDREGQRPTMLGIKRKYLACNAADGVQVCSGLKQFNNNTARKSVAAVALKSARARTARSAENPYAQPHLNPAKRLRLGHTLRQGGGGSFCAPAAKRRVVFENGDSMADSSSAARRVLAEPLMQ